MTLSSFEYVPLKAKDNIRLVQLVKDGQARHGFRVRLSETPLDDVKNSAFNALSYTWGLPFHEDITDLEKPNTQTGDTFNIECDDNHGLEVTITENLFYALKQIISNAGTESITPIWVDALCINQSNESEKSSQVNMMSDIYSAASKVIVWLGKDDPSPRFLWMHTSVELEKYLTDVAFGKLDGIPTADVLKSLGMESLQEWQDMWWNYVSFFRGQRYFRRVWIIQETALARDITVLCGSQVLDWTRLVVIGNLLLVSDVGSQWALLGKRTQLLSQHPGWIPGNEIRQLHMFRTDHLLNGGLPMHLHQTKANFMRGRQDLESDDTATEALLRGNGALGDKQHKELAYFAMVLRQFTDYQTTDKRDHVFAAQAFCAPFFKRAGMETPVTPNYQMTIQEVFTEVAAKLLTSLPALTLLSLIATEKKRVQDLPSWVPDFTAPFSFRPLTIRGFCLTPDKPDEGPHIPIYNATNTKWPRDESDHNPLAEIDGCRLRLSGTCIGRVETICTATSRTALEFSYIPYLEYLTTLPTRYELTGELREEAFWRTLCGNFCDTTYEYPASVFTGSLIFRRHILENIAATTINKMPDLSGGMAALFTGEMGGYLSTVMKTSELLTRLAAEGAGDLYLPNPIEIVAQVNSFIGLAFEVGSELSESLQGQGTAAREERLAAEVVTRMGTSQAEMEAMGMLAQGMNVPHKRLYTTENGALGVGPPGIQLGDEVWLIRGAKIPFVLRPMHQTQGEISVEGLEFTLLGETYVHGAMNGEMLKGYLRYQQIVIV